MTIYSLNIFCNSSFAFAPTSFIFKGKKILDLRCGRILQFVQTFRDLYVHTNKKNNYEKCGKGYNANDCTFPCLNGGKECESNIRLKNAVRIKKETNFMV